MSRWRLMPVTLRIRRRKRDLRRSPLDLMDEGTKTRDAFQIADELDSLGARLSTGSSLDMSFVRLQSTAENLQTSLGIMSDVVLNPSFPEDQFTIQKQQPHGADRAGKSQAERTCATHFAHDSLRRKSRLRKTRFGYGKPVETISREDLMKWHADWFKPGSSTVIVTGDTTMANSYRCSKKRFRNWQAGTAPKKNIATVAKTPGKKIYLIDKPDAPQSTIVAAHVSEPSGQAEDLAAEPVFQNFGGMATSRLNRNLRLDKHWSYGTSGQLRDSRGQRTFLFSRPCRPIKRKNQWSKSTKKSAMSPERVRFRAKNSRALCGI